MKGNMYFLYLFCLLLFVSACSQGNLSGDAIQPILKKVEPIVKPVIVQEVVDSAGNPVVTVFSDSFDVHQQTAIAEILDISCADVDNNGQVDISDLVNLVQFVYHNGQDLSEGTGDVNNDGLIDENDVSFLVAFMFEQGPEPDCLQADITLKLIANKNEYKRYEHIKLK